MSVDFKKNVPLAKHVAYQIGGKTRYFFEAKNKDELKEALHIAKEEKILVRIIGEGTNLLMSDTPFEGLVLRPLLTTLKISGTFIEVGAGVPMRILVETAMKHGLSGLEWAGGLPGSVGGAIRGNAGAFGGETKDSVQEVRSLEVESCKEKERANEKCCFGYRSSIFKAKDGKEIIISAILKLRKGNRKKIQDATQEKIAYRKERHPLEYPNVGSIFQNVDAKKVSAKTFATVARAIKTDPFPVVPAAFLISEAGLKGARIGGAIVSPKHPNFIVNMGEATAEDIKQVIAHVKQTVKKKFGIELHEEVQIF